MFYISENGRAVRRQSHRALGMCVLLSASMAGVGCSQSDEDAARSTVKTYLNALADADGPKACDQLTDAAQRPIL